MKKFFSILAVTAFLFTLFGQPAAFAKTRDYSDLTVEQEDQLNQLGSGAVSSDRQVLLGSLIRDIFAPGSTYGLYSRIPYVHKSNRPASGAPAGSQIAMYGLNTGDCGTNPGANTSFIVCMSDGTNWKAV